MKVEAIIMGVFGTNDRKDLERINEALRRRFRQLSELEVLNFTVGEAVFFSARGRRWDGEVVKVNRKSVTVNADGMRWKVGPSLLHRKK